MSNGTPPFFSVMAGILLLQTGSVPIWVPLAIILVVVLIFWWGLTRKNIPTEEPESAGHGSEHATEEVEAVQDSAEEESVSEATVGVLQSESEVEQAATTADNLQKIEGIGPKIEALLNNAGISTFDQLAETEVSELNRIVREEARIRVADPTTWPAQASFAAKGDWAALEAYQNRLVAGREHGE